MENINSVVIAGNLTREPEVKTNANGFSIMSFSIASNERKKVGEEWVDYANFIDCTVFGKQAEALSKILVKGMKVCVMGRLHWSTWEAKDGSGKRNKIEVLADKVEIMSGKRASDSNEPCETEDAGEVGSVYDGDIPF